MWDRRSWQRIPATFSSASAEIPFRGCGEELPHLPGLLDVMRYGMEKRSFHDGFLGYSYPYHLVLLESYSSANDLHSRAWVLALHACATIAFNIFRLAQLIVRSLQSHSLDVSSYIYHIQCGGPMDVSLLAPLLS